MRDADLASALEALASPTRLALLRSLRTPRILREIEVEPPEREGFGSLARQTIRRHLDVLIRNGVVETRDIQREGRDTTEFVVSHQAIYALAEELRDLARLRPEVDLRSQTTPGSAPASGKEPAGPLLTLVKGLDDGSRFDLTPKPPDRVEWIVGRRRGLAVALDFDPFVSAENTRIWWQAGAHFVETLPTSRNGTLVNFVPLPPGESRRLAHGDILSVGRSVLSYRA